MTYISGALSKDRMYVDVWEREKNKVKRKRYDAPYYFYMKNEDGEYSDIYGNKLLRVDFESSREFYDAKRQYKDQNVKLFESDINPIYKIISKHYHNKDVGKLNFSLFDIETDYDPKRGFASPENPYAPVSAISLYHHYSNRMILLVVLPDNGKWTEDDIPRDLYDIAEIVVCKTEKELLMRFLDEIEDSDIISGWNSAIYDVPYLYMRMLKRYGEAMANRLSFHDAPAPKTKEVEAFKGQMRLKVDIFGRCHLDYMEVMKKFEQTDRPSWALEAVSEDVTPEFTKLEYEGTLYHLYYDNFPHFCRYNVRDTEVLKAFEQKLGYMEIAILNYHSSTALIGDVLGTVKIVESALINKCHYELDVKVPDAKDPSPGSSEDDEKFAGALVLDPIMGMHSWVFSVDVNSLYPSAIRTLNISPEMLVGQFFNDHMAFEEICLRSTKNLTLMLDDDTSETYPANEWPEIFKERQWCVSGFGTVFRQDKKGFIPAILEEWYAGRKEFKAKMKVAKDNAKKYEKGSEENLKWEQEAAFYNRKQYIMKLLLNSTYGCLGNEFFKFFDIRMAESTTRSGRETLMHMVMTVALHLDGKYQYPSPSCIYSDTDSCYAIAPVDNLEDCVRLAKIIEKKVNDSFAQFTAEKFFCVGEFNGLIKAELDTIADKSIFVKKKFYIMHLLYSDGAPSEKMKVMGLQIKKTIIPAPIRRTLTGFMEEFLKGAEWNDIARKVVDYKDILIKDQLVNIGLPTGVKGVEDYTRRWNAKEPGLRVPGHVMTAIFYNKCLDHFGDLESPRIQSGMKIKKYYLNKPIDKFKAIALPTDLKNPPAWFIEHFAPLIDRNAQLLRLVDKPLQSILTAIGEYAPTKKTVLVADVFEY